MSDLSPAAVSTAFLVLLASVCAAWGLVADDQKLLSVGLISAVCAVAWAILALRA